MALDVEINGNPYTLVENRDGSKVSTRPVQQFVQPIRQTGRTRPEDLAPYESFIVPNLTMGFGRRRINSDSAFNADEYRRFFDSTCDTRWADGVFLPILVENSTSTGLERIRASAHFKGQLFGGWTDNTSTTITSYMYDGSDTTWDTGGQMAPQVLIDNHGGYGEMSSSTSLTYSHTVASQANRIIVVLVSSAGTTPSGVTYNGDALTQLDTQLNGGSGAHIWYRVAPDVGTANVVISFSGSTSASSESISLYNVHQSTPFGTAVKETGSSTGAQPSADVTTAVGDFVLDVVSAESSVTASAPGDGQTEIRDATAGSVIAVSYEYAQTTTTTMSETLSGSDAWAHVAAGVKVAASDGAVNTLFDMTIDKDHMVALIAEGDTHYAVRTSKVSNDTDSWSIGNGTAITSGLLANAVTSGEDLDGGLLASIGGELVAALWHESQKTITFFSSTDSGNTWTDENIDIGSGNGPQSLVVYPDIDGTDKLYLGTSQGIFLIDTAPSTWTFEMIYPMSVSENNCRDMTIHQGALWFAEGVDNNTPAPIYRMTVQGDSRVIESGFGLSFGDGVPDDLLGPVRRMKSSGDFLYISVGGGDSGRNARIMCWNSKGWHSMTKHETVNQVIDWLDVGTEDDGVSRLHFAVKTGATANSSHFLGHANTNPSSGVSINREEYSAGNHGHIDLPYYDLGLPHEDKNFTRIHVIADDLNSTDANEFIEASYGHNNAARTTEDIGDFLSTVTGISLGSGLGVQAKNIGLRVILKKRSGDGVHTPKLRDIVVEGYVVPDTAYEHNMVIDIEETAKATAQNVETVISNLETLISTVTQMSFKFGQVDKKVAVDRERSNFSYGINSWEVSGAPNALATRSGTFNLTLIEKIAS